MNKKRLQEIKDSINFQYELIVSKGIDKSALLFTDEEQELVDEIERLQNIIKEVREYILKHCVNEKISKEVGFKCYTMADTNELEHIMKILGDNDE